jgi:hypothetical protein
MKTRQTLAERWGQKYSQSHATGDLPTPIFLPRELVLAIFATITIRVPKIARRLAGLTLLAAPCELAKSTK